MRFPEFTDKTPKEPPPPPPPPPPPEPTPEPPPRGFRLSGLPAPSDIDDNATTGDDAGANDHDHDNADTNDSTDNTDNTDTPTPAPTPKTASGFALDLGDAVAPEPRPTPRKKRKRRRILKPLPPETATAEEAPTPARKRRKRLPPAPPPPPKKPPLRWRVGEIIEGYRLLEIIPTRPRRRTFRAVGVYDAAPVAFETWLPRADSRSPARIWTAIDTPGAARVLATGETSGRRFTIVVERDGEPLAQTLQWARQESEPSAFGGGARGIARCIEVIAATARAIDPIHEAGLSHGYLSPREISVAPDGAPVITSVAVDPERFRDPSSDELPYVAPEQWRGESATPATDVFALGAILFECLTLQPPFAGPTEQTYAENLRHGEVADPTAFNPDVAQPVATVLNRALERDPAHRFQSGGALADALTEAVSGGPVAPARGGSIRAARRWIHRHHRLAISAGLVLATGVMLTTVAGISAFQNEWRARAVATEADALEHGVGALNQLRLRQRIHTLTREGRFLWPSRPGWEGEMEAWLIRAGEVIESRPAIIDAAGQLSKNDAPDPDGVRRWGSEALRALLDDLESFSTLADDIGDRLAAGRAAHEASVIEHRLAWQRCLRAISINPRYIGTRFKPEPGLVPLGTDPDSGLHEFAHVSSGDLPRRDPTTGRIERRPRDAIVLVLIPAAEGERTGGSRVAIAPFLIAKDELTRAQLARLVGSREPPSAMPATELDWRTARNALNRAGLQLPTEVQWEIAATGDVVAATTGERAGSALRPTGQSPPNGYGLHDMFGNVAEWCRDPFAPHAFPPRDGDGLRLESDDGPHVVKGAEHFGAGASSGEADDDPVKARRHWRGASTLIGVRPARWSSAVPNTLRKSGS